MGMLLDVEKSRQIYIIDDDSEVRKSLHFLLSSYNITAWVFATVADFFDNFSAITPAPILLDVRMPDTDGLQMLTMLKDRSVHWPVVMMTAHGDVSVAVRAMKMGAIEFLEKPFQPEMLLESLEIAFAHLDRSTSTMNAASHARGMLQNLTAREHEVVLNLVEGASNKTIARRLDLSVRTVEMHRQNALSKLALKSVAELVMLVASAKVDSASTAIRGEGR